MASIEPAGNKWRIRWREGGRKGKKVTDPRRFNKKSEALIALTAIERALLIRGPVSLGAPLATDELGQRWVRSRIAAGKTTVAEAGRWWTAICKDRKWKTVADITPQSVQAWREQDGGAPSGAMRVVRSILRWARDYAEQQVQDRTLVALRPPGRRRKPADALMTDDEMAMVQAQADAIDPGTGAMVYCLSTYGWRPVSAGRVLVGDVDLDAPAITTHVKGGDVVRHPIDAEAVRRLRPLVTGRPADEAVWLRPVRALRPGKKGTVIAAFAERGAHSVVQWLSAKLAQRIEGKVVPFQVYRLKRRAMSRMARAGLSLAEVALFTGHRDLSQVMVYMRTNEADAAAALARLNPGARLGHNMKPKEPESIADSAFIPNKDGYDTDANKENHV